MWLVLSLLASAEPDLSGRYQLSTEHAELAAIHAAALDDALRSLPWAYRPFARPRLDRAIRNCAALRLELRAEVFRAECDGDAPYVHPRAEPQRAYASGDGEQYTAELDVATDHAVLSFVGADGGQRTRYRPRSDGTLVLEKTLFSEHLSEPVVWAVTYRRVE